jgi:hypothetical protein
VFSLPLCFYFINTLKNSDDEARLFHQKARVFAWILEQIIVFGVEISLCLSSVSFSTQRASQKIIKRLVGLKSRYERTQKLYSLFFR